MVYRIALVFYAQLVPELRTIGTALLTGAGVVSIVVGLAARGALGNLIDGFALVVSRTAQVDDSIRLYTAVGTISARIRAISLGFTHLTDSDGNEVIVPNSVMMGSAIVRIRPLPPSLATAPDDKRGAP
ncbi:MAG: mechanosensitive ion channel domain-containing protein [Gammaproteobacteria bacterium]